MSWWRNLLGGKTARSAKKPDYLREALDLEASQKWEDAMISYRLALRDDPTNTLVLQNMAICYTRAGKYEPAIRTYRRALDINNKLAGAHYGIAFLLLRSGDMLNGEQHLAAFQAEAPRDRDVQAYREYAQRALASLSRPAAPTAPTVPPYAPAYAD